MAGKVNLAIFTDDPSVRIDQYRGVEVMPVGCELGIAKRNSNTILGCGFEQRPRRRARHFAFEPGVDLDWIGHVPAREECRKRELWIHYEIAAGGFRLGKQIQHPADDRLPALGFLDRTHLRTTNPQDSAHAVLLRRGDLHERT